MNLNHFMADKMPPNPEPAPEQTESVSAADTFDELPDGRIPQGQRNTTMSRLAGKLIKRYGNTREVREKFLEKAKACDPPLDMNELKTIWGSAAKFGKTISAQAGYVPPEEYNGPTPRKPDDYSDVGQAYAFAKHCRDYVR